MALTTAIAAVAAAGVASAAQPGADPGAAATALSPFEATYTVTWKGLNAGTSTLALEQTGPNAYTYSSRNVARGVFRLALPDAIRQRSELKLEDGRVVPLRYRGDDGSDDTSRDVTLDFDWQRMRVSGTAEDKPVDLALEPRTQDPMSVQLSQRIAAASGGETVRLPMVDKDEIKVYEFSCSGTETVETKLGKLEARICESRRDGSSRVTRMWIAPSLDYIPVRAVRLREGKVEFSMQIERLTRAGE